MYDDFELQMVKTNDVTLRVAVEGDGPLLIMVHGWPELWYSWRHQIKPLAAAGYRVLVPDVRGYGGSDKPYAVTAYDMKTLMADVIGLVDAFGEDQAVLVGHDWGAPIVWNTAALHPERVAAVAGLSVPYRKRGDVSHIGIWRRVYEGRFFYQVYFQEEGTAERELERDVRVALRKMYFTASGDSPNADGWVNRPAADNFLGGLVDPDPFPPWLSTRDLEYFASNFEAGGFRGPINRYRNQDRDFIELPDMGVVPVTQPSCFIAGTEDIVRKFVPGIDPYASAGDNCTDYRGTTLIDGAGHWVQQEAPQEVNAALLKFLESLR